MVLFTFGPDLGGERWNTPIASTARPLLGFLRMEMCLNRIRSVVAALFAVVLCLPQYVRAAEPVVIPSTYAHALHSRVNGVDYKLSVVLPPSYETKSNAHFPVFYVLDGNRWAMLLGVMLPRLWSAGIIPEFIVVGIDYPGKSGRTQDYAPVTQRYFPMDPQRGASVFMRVIKEEIIPFVETTYRADPKDRGIGGHSMGGFFTAYALLHETDTFHRFWMSSPSLFWDDEVLFKDIPAFNSRVLSERIQVFASVGGDELPAMVGTLQRFSDKLQERQSGKIVLKMWVQPGENHTTVVPSVFTQALEDLYAYRPRVTPAASDLLRFAGRYKLTNGTVITLVGDGRDLLYRDSTVEFESGSLQRMTAYAPNKFFLPAPRIEIEFPDGPGVPQRIRFSDVAGEEELEGTRLP